MDSIPPRQFLDMFKRMNMYIDVKGCQSPDDIEQRMLQSIHLMENGVRMAKKESTKRKWLGRIKLMWIAMDNHSRVISKTAKIKRAMGNPARRSSFQERVIEEAIAHPNSIYNYALRYGYDKGKKKKLEDARRRMGVLTVHRRGIHSRKRMM